METLNKTEILGLLLIICFLLAYISIHNPFKQFKYWWYCRKIKQEWHYDALSLMVVTTQVVMPYSEVFNMRKTLPYKSTQEDRIREQEWQLIQAKQFIRKEIGL